MWIQPPQVTSDVGANPRPEAMPAMNVTDGGPRGADSSKVLVVPDFRGDRHWQ